MGDSELKPLYLFPFVKNSGYQGIRRESTLYFWVIFFWGVGADLFPFHD